MSLLAAMELTVLVVLKVLEEGHKLVLVPPKYGGDLRRLLRVRHEDL
jgi:hypothetical protein